MNKITKYVFSNTLEEATWTNATIVRGDAAVAVRELKEQGSGDLVIYGHGPLGQALLDHGLLDELRLVVTAGAAGLIIRRRRRRAQARDDDRPADLGFMRAIHAGLRRDATRLQALAPQLERGNGPARGRAPRAGPPSARPSRCTTPPKTTTCGPCCGTI